MGELYSGRKHGTAARGMSVGILARPPPAAGPGQGSGCPRAGITPKAWKVLKKMITKVDSHKHGAQRRRSRRSSAEDMQTH